MIRKRTKYIFTSMAIFVLAGIAIGYYYFNKGPVDIRSGSAVSVEATALYEQFKKDSVNALKDYAGKILLVTGEVSNITANQQNEKIILLKTNTEGASVNCTMEQDPGSVKINERVSVKGVSAGIGQGDEDLGIMADVYLTRCYLIK